MNPVNLILCSAAAGSLLLSSCATIVSKGSWPVMVHSQPEGLDFTVTDSEGSVVSSGKAPKVVMLSSKGGYFKPAAYTFRTKRNGKVVGEHQVTASLNGWYWGNIVFGGLIGSLIVDPLTGAMYRLPYAVDVKSGDHGIAKAAAANPHSLTIASIETLTPEQRGQLVRL